MWQELTSHPSRPPTRSVEITAIRTTGIIGNPRADGSNFTWGIVSVETDAGVTGFGETFRGEAPLDLVERIAPTVIGDNPLDPPRIAETLSRTHYPASGGWGRSAIAAIEMACWDVKGKVLDVPLYELLGGKYRDTVPLYADSETLAGETVGIDHTEEYTPDEYAAAAREAVDMGFSAIKFDLDVPTPNLIEDRAARYLDADGIEHKVALVEAVRAAVGPSITLGMDCHWSYTVETAIRLCTALEPYDLAFVEDPVHPEKIEAQARVKAAAPMPILTGENLTSADEFLVAFTNDLLDIAAPDISMCSGLGELSRIASIADCYDVPLAPHNLGSPVATMAGVHLAASIPNVLSIEFRGGDAPWWGEIVARTGEEGPILDEGTIVVPEGPGLGIEFTSAIDQYVDDDRHLVP